MKYSIKLPNAIFMNAHPEYLESSIWNKEIIIDPYAAITDVFTVGDLVSYRKTLKKMFIAACSEKVYKRTSPATLIYDLKKIELIINAAYILNKSGAEPLENVNENDFFNKPLFVGRHSYLTDWDYLPRSLSKDEYKNPYLAFESFFKFQPIERWKFELYEIFESSISESSLLEEGTKINVILLSIHLQKILEAVHLIYVRELGKCAESEEKSTIES